MMKVSDIQFILDKMDERQLKHANNTACLAYAMGQAINCPAQELNALWFSGLLLESGKLCISGKIKIKIDTSFEEEFDIINRKEKLDNYILYTQSLLKSLESIEEKIDFGPASIIIEQVEENVDGSGLSRHLQAGEIDTLSKVLKIASYYDNLRLDGKTHDGACKEIRKFSDQYFPAKIITPFIKMIVKNELHKDYTEEKDFTIGNLSEKDMK